MPVWLLGIKQKRKLKFSIFHFVLVICNPKRQKLSSSEPNMMQMIADDCRTLKIHNSIFCAFSKDSQQPSKTKAQRKNTNLESWRQPPPSEADLNKTRTRSETAQNQNHRNAKQEDEKIRIKETYRELWFSQHCQGRERGSELLCFQRPKRTFE